MSKSAEASAALQRHRSCSLARAAQLTRAPYEHFTPRMQPCASAPREELSATREIGLVRACEDESVSCSCVAPVHAAPGSAQVPYASTAPAGTLMPPHVAPPAAPTAANGAQDPPELAASAAEAAPLPAGSCSVYVQVPRAPRGCSASASSSSRRFMRGGCCLCGRVASPRTVHGKLRRTPAPGLRQAVWRGRDGKLLPRRRRARPRLRSTNFSVIDD